MDVNSFVIGYNKGKASAPAGAGVELNIAYGDTPPEDTSKLWVKTSEPSKVTIQPNMDGFAFEDELKKQTTFSNIAHACSAVSGNNMYIIGGASSTNAMTQKVVNKIYRSSATYWYNDNGKITTPQPMMRACAVAYDTLIYTFGGYSTWNNSVNAWILCIDTVASTCNSFSISLPYSLQFGCCARVGDKTYIFGGNTKKDASGRTGKILRFVPENSTIEQTAEEFPTGIQNMCCEAVGTKIYLFGGNTATDGTVDTIYCFDTETETLLLLETRLPVPLAGAACASIGDYIYIFGGCVDFNAPTHSYNIYRFNTQTHRIEKTSASMPKGVYALCANTVDYDGNGTERIFLAGGGEYTSSNFAVTNVSNEISVYAPSEDFELPNGDMLIITDSESNVFTVASAADTKIEIGVSDVFKGDSENIGKLTEAALYKDGTWTTI